MAQSPGAVEVEPINTALGKTVVGHAGDRRVSRQQLPLHIDQGADQLPYRGRGHGIDLHGGGGGDRLGAKVGNVVIDPEGAGLLGGFQGQIHAQGIDVAGGGDPHLTVGIPHPHDHAGTVRGLDLLGVALVDLNASFIDGRAVDVILGNAELLGA